MPPNIDTCCILDIHALANLGVEIVTFLTLSKLFFELFRKCLSIILIKTKNNRILWRTTRPLADTGTDKSTNRQTIIRQLNDEVIGISYQCLCFLMVELDI